MDGICNLENIVVPDNIVPGQIWVADLRFLSVGNIMQNKIRPIVILSNMGHVPGDKQKYYYASITSSTPRWRIGFIPVRIPNYKRSSKIITPPDISFIDLLDVGVIRPQKIQGYVASLDANTYNNCIDIVTYFIDKEKSMPSCMEKYALQVDPFVPEYQIYDMFHNKILTVSEHAKILIDDLILKFGLHFYSAGDILSSREFSQTVLNIIYQLDDSEKAAVTFPYGLRIDPYRLAVTIQSRWHINPDFNYRVERSHIIEKS